MRFLSAFLITCVLSGYTAHLRADLVVEDVGAGLDSFVIDLISEYESGETSKPFNQLRDEIESVFLSTPTVLRLIEVQRGLFAEIDKAEAVNNTKVSVQLDQGYQANENRADGDAGTQTITASKPIYDFGAHQHTVKQAEALVHSERTQIEVARSSALLSLVQARVGLSSAADNLELTRQFVDSRAQFEQFVTERRDLGASSDADLIRATAKALEAEGELPSSKQALEDALGRYVELFGRQAPMPERFKLPSVDPLNLSVDVLVRSHPDVEGKELALEAAEAELEGFERSLRGAFVFESAVTRSENPESRTDEQVNVRIVYQRNLIDGGSADAEIQQLKAQIAELGHDLQQTIDARTRSILEARSAFSASLELLSIKVKALRASRRSNQVTKELYAYDRGSLNDLFDAQDDYLSAAQSVVAELGRVQIAFYQLLHESGVLIDEFQDAI